MPANTSVAQCLYRKGKFKYDHLDIDKRLLVRILD